MPKYNRIGILCVSKADQSRLAMITLHPSGVLIYSSMRKDMHPYALKPVESYLKKKVLKVPLYVKYEKLMDSKSELPEDILKEEAMEFARLINMGDVQIGSESVTASVVRYEDEDE